MDASTAQKTADAFVQILSAAEVLKTAGFVLKFEVAPGQVPPVPTVATAEPPPQPSGSRIDQFIAAYRSVLTEDDLEFLEFGPQVGTDDVREYLGTSRRATQKLLRSGVLKPGVDDKPGVSSKYDTISVVEYVLRGKRPLNDAEAEEK